MADELNDDLPSPLSGAEAEGEFVPMDTDDPPLGQHQSPPPPANDQPPETVDQPTLDLEGYISGYTGLGKIQRLMFIASRSPALAVDALTMALAEIKRGTLAAALYREAADLLQKACQARGLPVPSIALDQAWVDRTEKDAVQQLDGLDRDLKSNRNKQIKSSIRLGYADMGDFYYKRGDLPQALRNYIKTRDYCSSPDDIIHMCRSAILVSVHMKNWPHVLTYCQKAEATPDYTTDKFKSEANRIKCIMGLAQLASKRYKLAAKCFLDANIDLCTNFGEVLTVSDIGVYGGLCALASFDRSELKRQVIDNTQFKQFLENNPSVRELITDFYHSRYASCLAHLANIKADCLLDMYLHSHVAELYTNIRKKALVQYFSPYVSVDLTMMAEAFGTDVAGLQGELVALIGDDVIQARIDSHNKILYKRQVDQRSQTYERALEMGKNYRRHTQALLLRVALLNEEVVVKPDDRAGRLH